MFGELEEEETVMLDDGLPGQQLVTIINFCEEEEELDEDTLMVWVVDCHQQKFMVSLYRLSKPF